jgi:hypothetical protein
VQSTLTQDHPSNAEISLFLLFIPDASFMSVGTQNHSEANFYLHPHLSLIFVLSLQTVLLLENDHCFPLCSISLSLLKKKVSLSILMGGLPCPPFDLQLLACQ